MLMAICYRPYVPMGAIKVRPCQAAVDLSHQLEGPPKQSGTAAEGLPAAGMKSAAQL